MKRSELIISVALVPLDFLALLAAAWSAFSIRHLGIITGIRPILFDFSAGEYLKTTALIALVWIFFFAVAGLYRHRSTVSGAKEFGRIFVACSAGLLAITMIVFLRGELFSSRFIIIAGWALAVVYVFLMRLIVRRVERSLFSRGYVAHRVAIVGTGHVATSVAEAMREQPERGYILSGSIEPTSVGLEILRDLVREDRVDEVFFIDMGSTPESRQLFMDFAEDEHIAFRYAPDVFVSPVGEPSIDFDFGVPIVELRETTLDGWGRVAKRIVDTFGALLAMIVLSPIFFARVDGGRSADHLS
jgi:FlaA1/EpsC-like NDP-sugar epimerase